MKPNGAVYLKPEHSCAKHDFEDVNNPADPVMQGGINDNVNGHRQMRSIHVHEGATPWNGPIEGR